MMRLDRSVNLAPGDTPGVRTSEQFVDKPSRLPDPDVGRAETPERKTKRRTRTSREILGTELLPIRRYGRKVHVDRGDEAEGRLVRSAIVDIGVEKPERKAEGSNMRASPPAKLLMPR